MNYVMENIEGGYAYVIKQMRIKCKEIESH